MNQLIKKIIDGEHTIEELDLITYPELGANEDVMEIAVDVNPNFIKYATIEYKRYRSNKSTIDIYEYALKKGYIPRGIDFEKNPNLKKQSCIKEKAINEIKEIINKLQNSNYTISSEEALNYSLIIKNVSPDYKEIYFNLILNQNPRFIKFLDIRSFDTDNIINERIISNIIQKGYIPIEEDFINNRNLGFLYNMMEKAIEVNPNFIKYILLDESKYLRMGPNYLENIKLFEKAILQGFIPQVDDIKNNYYLASSKLIMKKAIEINPTHFKYTKNYSDELVNYAIQNGYILTEDDINNNPKLLTSNILMKKAIDIDYKYILISCDGHRFGFENITANTIKYAISKGYSPTKEEIDKNYNWYSNNDIMMVLIEKNPDFVELAKNYETLFDFAITKGYNPSFIKIRNNKNLLESLKLCNYLLKNDITIINNGFLNEYIKRDAVKGITLDFINKIWEFIDNNIVYENMNYNEMLTIIKYIYGEDLYYKQLKEQLNELIKNGQFKTFNDIINILTENKNYNTKYKLNLIIDIIHNFNKYYNLCCSFLSSNYNKKDIYLLRYLLFSEETIQENINSIQDLEKYNEILYQERKNKINNITPDWVTGEYETYNFYDSILLMLFNMKYDEYMKQVHNGFSSKDINILINNINNHDIKEELNRYKIVIKLIENILAVKDTKILKTFAHRLNESIYKNSEAVIDIYNILRNIENIKKYYYGIEITEKLLDISKLEPTSKEILENEEEKEKQEYIRENKKYSCPNIEIHGQTLTNEKVDYIELKDLDFTFFVHVLNAYGKGGTLEDFKRARLIGKTYICVSPITDNYYWGLAESNDTEEEYSKYFDDIDDEYEDEDDEWLLDIAIENADNVKLIFSAISPEQLVAMGNQDLGTTSDDNSLEIFTSVEENYAPIRQNVDSLEEEDYCEYVLYREDNKGNQIYPTAILSTEEKPSKAEIIAAAYLQIPIVHINDKYLERNKQEIPNSQTTKLQSQQELKQQLEEMKNILLKGIKRVDASVIPERRKK